MRTMLAPAVGSSEIITMQKIYQYGFAEAFWSSENCYSPLRNQIKKSE